MEILIKNEITILPSLRGRHKVPVLWGYCAVRHKLNIKEWKTQGKKKKQQQIPPTYDITFGGFKLWTHCYSWTTQQQSYISLETN